MALDDYHPGHTGPHTSSAGNSKEFLQKGHEPGTARLLVAG